MTRVSIALAFVLVLVSLAQSGSGQKPPGKPAELPPSVSELQLKLQGKSAEQIRDIVILELGEPTRDIGSGLHIPQWDIAGGVITVHPGRGPTFTDKDGSLTWLIHTKNLIGANIVGDYEMYTRSDPANHGNRFWIGNVKVNADGTYQYTRNEANSRELGKEPNVLIDHPRGTYAVHYPQGMTKETQMEQLKDGTILATLEFEAEHANGKAFAKGSIGLRCDLKARRLCFAALEGQSLPFELEKSWANFWN